MQTIRLLCFLLCLGVAATQTLDKPGSESSYAIQESINPSAMGAVSSQGEPQAQRLTFQATENQGHRSKSASQANPDGVLDSDKKLPHGLSQLPGQRDVVPSVVDELRLLGQVSVDYRKRTGKFPLSLAALKVTRRLDMRQGYRFNYRRRRSADSFAVTAVPTVAHLRGMPRLSID